MNFTTQVIRRFFQYSQTILSAGMIFSFFPLSLFPGLHDGQLKFVSAPVSKDRAVEVLDRTEPIILELSQTFFGGEAGKDSTDKIIEKQIEFVSSRKAFGASLSVIKKHEETIRRIADKEGVPADVAIGVALLENGGSETAVSSAGALGVFQLMPGTARSLGLTVNKKVDERKNVEKNISAGISYLRQNYDRFGDWGLATWAYHAGEGNVTKALQLFAKANSAVKLPGLKDASKLRTYVEKNDVTIHKLLSSVAVKNLTKKLSDDSAGYPYKVIATATLYRNLSQASFTLPGLIVESL